MGMIEDVGDAQAEAERWNSKGQRKDGIVGRNVFHPDLEFTENARVVITCSSGHREARG